MSLSNKRILIADYGLNIYIAEILRESYEKVYYFNPGRASFPTSHKAMIGRGIEGIEKVHFMDFYKYVDKADIIAFLDLFFTGDQYYLRKNKYRVYGAGDAEELEVDRAEFKKVLAEYKLPVIPTEPITGYDKFLAYMKNQESKFIKFSCYRGDSETHHWTNYEESRNWIRYLAHKLGDRAEIAQFLIEDEVKGDCEPGYDGWIIDDKFSPWGGIGYEVKDEGIIEKVYRNEVLPKIVKNVNDKLSPYFAKKKYRGNYSAEMRIDKKGIAWYNDATCRIASPAGEVMSDLFRDDYAQMIWDIAEGTVPKMKPKAKYGVQLMLHSEWYRSEWLTVSYPKEIEQWVKLRNKCIIKGAINCIPQDNVTTVGTVTAIGNTIDEAINLCIERANQVKGEGIQFDESTFDKAKESIKEGTKYGIIF